MCFLFKSSKTMLWRHHNIYVSLYWKYLRLAISSMLQIKDSFFFFFSQNTLDIDFTYTTHTLNKFNKYPSITCSYIQEYLGYRSNNLYFLFSHSWPVVVYTFGQVQLTSQVERKTKCSKKTKCFTAGDIALLNTIMADSTSYQWKYCIQTLTRQSWIHYTDWTVK